MLVALSCLYWAVAIIAAIAVGFGAQGDCVTKAGAVVANDALYQLEFAQCKAVFAVFGALVLAYAAVAFGVIAAVYFTVRWIIRGFRNPA